MKEELRETITDMYYDYLHENGFISIRAFADWLVKQRAPRFYIGYENARRGVSKVLKGCKSVRPIYIELAEKLKETEYYKSCKRYHYLPLLDIIEQEASSFYLTPSSVVNIIYKELRQRLRVKK